MAFDAKPAAPLDSKKIASQICDHFNKTIFSMINSGKTMENKTAISKSVAAVMIVQGSFEANGYSLDKTMKKIFSIHDIAFWQTHFRRSGYIEITTPIFTALSDSSTKDELVSQGMISKDTLSAYDALMVWMATMETNSKR
jgi:hypothetical protein